MPYILSWVHAVRRWESIQKKKHFHLSGDTEPPLFCGIPRFITSNRRPGRSILQTGRFRLIDYLALLPEDEDDDRGNSRLASDPR